MEELKATEMIDSDDILVREFTLAHTQASHDNRTNAVALYYAVRDKFRYDPYTIELTAEGLRASHVLELDRGWCVSKAILLAACCRAAGIPSRLGYADVRNHLSTERMRKQMGTDVFLWHGYTSILIDGNWVKATPAFNVELCDKFRLQPLEFDGTEDSIYHPLDLDGQRHMEYLNFRGEFTDVPLEPMAADMHATYPHLVDTNSRGDFEQEVAQETDAL